VNVAIMGAGNGGASAAVELNQKGHTIRLWNRSKETLLKLKDIGGIKYEGVFGEGFAELAEISTDLKLVTQDAEVIMVCLPTQALGDVAHMLAEKNMVNIPVILNPGHTCGALEFVSSFHQRHVSPPPVAEFSTLTYVARKSASDKVQITGAAKHVWVAPFPGGEQASDKATKLYPIADRTTNVLATGLANVNMVLHPPGAILGASWIERTHGDFTFYVEGLTQGVGEVLEALDKERIKVASSYGLELPDLFDEMQMIGTIEPEASRKDGLAAAVRAGEGNKNIKAPGSLSHRYYVEDFFYGLKPFIVLANIAGVKVPVATALLQLGETLSKSATGNLGRTAEAMGIEGMQKNQLLNYIKLN